MRFLHFGVVGKIKLYFGCYKVSMGKDMLKKPRTTDSFYQDYIVYISQPCRRLLLLVLVINTVFLLTTPYGDWHEALWTILTLLVYMYGNVRVLRNLRAEQPKKPKCHDADKRIMHMNAKLAIVGSLAVFVAYLLGLIVGGYHTFFSSFSMVLHKLLSGVVLALSWWIAVYNKEWLQTMLATGRGGWLLWRWYAIAILLGVSLVGYLFQTGQGFVAAQLFILFMLIEYLSVVGIASDVRESISIREVAKLWRRILGAALPAVLLLLCLERFARFIFPTNICIYTIYNIKNIYIHKEEIFFSGLLFYTTVVSLMLLYNYGKVYGFGCSTRGHEGLVRVACVFAPLFILPVFVDMHYIGVVGLHWRGWLVVGVCSFIVYLVTGWSGRYIGSGK